MTIQYKFNEHRRILGESRQGDYFQDKYGKVWQRCQKVPGMNNTVFCTDLENGRIKRFGLHTLVWPAKVETVVSLTMLGNGRADLR